MNFNLSNALSQIHIGIKNSLLVSNKNIEYNKNSIVDDHSKTERMFRNKMNANKSSREESFLTPLLENGVSNNFPQIKLHQSHLNLFEPTQDDFSYQHYEKEKIRETRKIGYSNNKDYRLHQTKIDNFNMKLLSSADQITTNNLQTSRPYRIPKNNKNGFQSHRESKSSSIGHLMQTRLFVQTKNFV
jgi:hypothetical protein